MPLGVPSQIGKPEQKYGQSPREWEVEMLETKDSTNYTASEFTIRRRPRNGMHSVLHIIEQLTKGPSSNYIKRDNSNPLFH